MGTLLSITTSLSIIVLILLYFLTRQIHKENREDAEFRKGFSKQSYFPEWDRVNNQDTKSINPF